jgi:SAM-dependent methyltransferase
MAELAYTTLERVPVVRPVDRIGFIAARCEGKRVLDIGCLDETALNKRGTSEWLHARIADRAASVVGIDLSDQLTDQGLVTAPNARIVKGDGTRPHVPAEDIDIIVAGEFIEHLENPLDFLRELRARYAGRELVISTPNGASLANGLMGMIGREAQHPDHLLTSTYKTLNTLCRRAGVREWEIIPYRFFATEMLLGSKGVFRLVVRLVESGIRLAERFAPLRSFGYVVRITL